MDLSVVVATLNGRDRLAACLDALAEHAGDAETIVVNGPSTDGTTGMVREREDVDVLIELADRNVNAARNAGAEAATGDAVAFLDERSVIEPGWRAAVGAALADHDVVTGPVRRPMRVGTETTTPERRRIAGREVTYFDGGNVAFAREALERLDGFDEYLDVGGSRDAAHRAAGLGLDAAWVPDAAIRREAGAIRADGDGDRDWGRKYRSLAYRLAKNYGPRPTVAARTLRHAVADGAAVLDDVLDGEYPPSAWIARGRDVAANGLRGLVDGLRARYRSGNDRNTGGISSRADRAVRTYDWR